MKGPIPSKALEQHIVVLGKTGSGKSYAVRGAAVEPLLDAGARVCVIDPTGAWHGLRSSASGSRAGYPVVIFGGEHADLPLGAAHGEAIAEVIGTSSTPSILDTSLMKVSERTRFFADFGDAIMRKNKGPLHLVIDEAHLFMPQGKVASPQAGEMLAAGNNMVSGGRSRGLRIILVTQRPAKLHKDSLTQAETLIAMRMIAPQDRAAVEAWIEDNADEAKAREIISSLATLKTGQGWIWAPELGMLERATFPKIKTFDSGRAPDGTEAESAKVLAPIDRDAIAAKLQSVSAAALADDPKRLRARIAELERHAKSGIPGPSREDLKAAETRGYEKGHQDGIREAQKAAAAHLKGLRSALHQALESALGAAPAPLPSRPTTVPAMARTAIPRHKPAPAPRVSGDSQVTAPQQKLLDRLAWLEEHGLYPAPKETLAAVAGVSPTSGGYFNNLGALRSAGLIDYPSPGQVGFTDSGRALADAGDDPRPVHEHWLDIVTGPQRKILEALIERQGEPVEKDALAEAIGVSPTSGGYFNNLGRLRTLGAIDYPQRGHVALTRHVMPD